MENLVEFGINREKYTEISSLLICQEKGLHYFHCSFWMAILGFFSVSIGFSKENMLQAAYTYYSFLHRSNKCSPNHLFGLFTNTLLWKFLAFSQKISESVALILVLCSSMWICIMKAYPHIFSPKKGNTAVVYYEWYFAFWIYHASKYHYQEFNTYVCLFLIQTKYPWTLWIHLSFKLL